MFAKHVARVGLGVKSIRHAHTPNSTYVPDEEHPPAPCACARLHKNDIERQCIAPPQAQSSPHQKQTSAETDGALPTGAHCTRSSSAVDKKLPSAWNKSVVTVQCFHATDDLGHDQKDFMEATLSVFVRALLLDALSSSALVVRNICN